MVGAALQVPPVCCCCLSPSARGCPMARALHRLSNLAGLLVLAGCRTPSDVHPPGPPVPVVLRAAPSAAPAEDDPVRLAIATFAGARGGLHAAPIALPYRCLAVENSPAWLFFVGGEVAQTAWVVTRGADHIEPGQYPHFLGVGSSGTANELVGDILFERVVYWPHAVKVVNAVPVGRGNAVAVALESLAVRNQPGGLPGVAVVEEDVQWGSLMMVADTANVRWRSLDLTDTGALLRRVTGALTVEHPSLVDEDAAVQALHAASVSEAALAGALGPAGVDVYETWQGTFTRRAEHLDPASLRTSPRRGLLAWAREISSLRLCYDGTCADGHPSGHTFVFGPPAAPRLDVILVPNEDALPEGPAVPAPGSDEALFRTFAHLEGALRPVARWALGPDHTLAVVSTDDGSFLVERDGAFAAEHALAWDNNEVLAARILPVGPGGAHDLLLFGRRGHDDDELPWARVVHRARRVDGAIDDGRFEPSSLAMIGARNIDEAAALRAAALAGPPPLTPTVAEACALLGSIRSPAAFRAHATPGARVVFFVSPGEPDHPDRIVEASKVSASDVSWLPWTCSANDDIKMACADGLCGQLGYGLGSYFRFVRKGKALQIDLALIYKGS
jgi:hypothetical protein